MQSATSMNWLSNWRKFEIKNDTIYHLSFGERADKTKAKVSYRGKNEFELYYPKDSITHTFKKINLIIDDNLTYQEFWDGFYQRKIEFDCFSESETKANFKTSIPESIDSTANDEVSTKKLFTLDFEKTKEKVDATVMIFFKEIALGNISPEWTINSKGYYQVNMSSYFKKLDSLNIFDSSFYEDESIRMKPCIDDLEKMKVKKDDNYDGIWEPASCFADYMYWLNAQEEPESYEITKGKIDNDTIKIEVKYVSIYGAKTTYWDNVLLNIELIEKRNRLLISKASIVNLN